MLNKNGVLFRENVSSKTLSTYKGGGVVKYVVYPRTISDIRKVAQYLQNVGLPFFILGNGSNTLVRDIGFKGVFISTKLMDKVRFYGNEAYCGCGSMVKSVYLKAVSLGLSGLEKLASIPSTMGGLIKGNGGAFNQEIKDIITDVDVLNLTTFNVERKAKEDINFSYRSTDLDNYFIIGARLKFDKKDKEEIQNIYSSTVKVRKLTQPNESSIGCVFCNGENYKVARLIDSLGLKGYSVGGAMVSLKHANFIVNTGVGTATDYLKVMEKIESRVLSEFKIVLKKEIKIV